MMICLLGNGGYSYFLHLNKEWDTERVLEASAATFTVLGSTLSYTSKNYKWRLFTGIIGLFLLQHSLQGWCPPLPVIRKFGVRTAAEIDLERDALSNLLEQKLEQSVT